eukprot:3956676-Prymnesium_polylepis.1
MLHTSKLLRNGTRGDILRLAQAHEPRAHQRTQQQTVGVVRRRLSPDGTRVRRSVHRDRRAHERGDEQRVRLDGGARAEWAVRLSQPRLLPQRCTGVQPQGASTRERAREPVRVGPGERSRPTGEGWREVGAPVRVGVRSAHRAERETPTKRLSPSLEVTSSKTAADGAWRAAGAGGRHAPESSSLVRAEPRSRTIEAEGLPSALRRGGGGGGAFSAAARGGGVAAAWLGRKASWLQSSGSGCLELSVGGLQPEGAGAHGCLGLSV